MCLSIRDIASPDRKSPGTSQDWCGGKNHFALDYDAIPAHIVAHGLGFFTSTHANYRPMRAIQLGAIRPTRPNESNFGLVDVLLRGYSQFRDRRIMDKPRDAKSCPMI
jgi:hypothetical protein